MKNKIRSAILISLFAVFAYLFLSHLGLFSTRYNYSVLVAAGIVYVNFIVFVISYYFSHQKPVKIFIIYTLGSLLIRLFLMIITVLISIKFLKVDIVGFIFAFFILYVFLLVYEILIVQSGLESRKTR